MGLGSQKCQGARLGIDCCVWSTSFGGKQTGEKPVDGVKVVAEGEHFSRTVPHLSARQVRVLETQQEH